MMPINDALFLLAEAREKPMHVAGLQLFRLPDGADPNFVGELHRMAVRSSDVHPRLGRRATRSFGGLGPWGWEPDPRLDLEYHVRHSALPQPGRVRELLALISRLHGTLLDRNRPLWEAHLIEGLAGGRFATYTKVHHGLIDGVAAMKLLERALSTDADEMGRGSPWATPPSWDTLRGRRGGSGGGFGPAALVEGVQGAAGAATQGTRAVVGASIAATRAFLTAFQDQAQALPYQAPRSPLNVPITGARRIAAQSWELERLAAVRAATGATLNDVFMAMCGGALRAYLDELGELPDQPLVSMVPVSLREDGDEDTGNAVGVILCNLGTHLADPEERLELIRRSMRQGKLAMKGLDATGVMLLSALSFAPLALGPLFRFEALRKPPFNIVISNVPGPKERLYWNGVELLGTYPVSILTDGQALNITVTTYAGSLEVGIVGDRQALPSLQRLLVHLEDSLSDLEKIAAVA